MKKSMLRLFLLVTALFSFSPAWAGGLVTMKASFPLITECKAPKSQPKSQEFSLPGKGTLVFKMWVKPHVDPAVHGPVWMTVGNEPLYRYLKRGYELLTVDGVRKSMVNGRPYYWEIHYQVQKPLKHCKLIIRPPQNGCKQWKQVVEVTLNFYPEGQTPPHGNASSASPSGKGASSAKKASSVPDNYVGVWIRREKGKVIDVIKINRSGAKYEVAFQDGFNAPVNATANGQYRNGALRMTSHNLKTNNKRRITMVVQGDRLHYTSTDLDGSHKWSGTFVRH